MPVSLFPVILAAHVALAIGLFVPSMLLPFAFRPGPHGRVRAADGPAVRALLWLQSHGTVVVGAGLAATGLALVSMLGSELLQQPWLLVALSVYGLNLVLAFFVQRPNVRRLLRLTGDDAGWRTLARRQRYVSYAMAGLVGTIGFLMSTKPELW